MKKLVLTLSLLLVTAVPAYASTFLQFIQVDFNTPFVITESGGISTSITAIDVPVNLTFDPSFCLVVGCNGLTDGIYSLNLNASSTGTAINTAGVISQNFGGVISFTQGGVNLLTVNFSDEFSGSAGGSSPALNSSQPPDIFTGSSDVLDPAKLFTPRGFSLSFSEWSPGLSITGSTISSATGDATGTFSASEVNTVPEPTSILMLGTGLAYVARRVSKNRNKR